MYNSCFTYYAVLDWRDGVKKLAYFKLEFFWHMIMYGARAASIRHPRNLRPFCFKTNNNDVRITSRNMARIWLEKLHFFLQFNQEPTRVVHKYDMIRHICIPRTLQHNIVHLLFSYSYLQSDFNLFAEERWTSYFIDKTYLWWFE